MVRTWGQVVDAAGRLWAVLPPAVPMRRSEPDLMPPLRQMANGIAATTSVGHWPGAGTHRRTLLQIAHHLSRARILVERYGRDVEPTTADVRADIAAARARIMHTLYVSAHGTAVAITEHTKNLQDQLQIDIRRRRPVAERPSSHEIGAAQALSIRFGVFEQLVGGYVAAHPVTPAVLGESKAVPPASRLQSVLAGWDIQAHRTLLANRMRPILSAWRGSKRSSPPPPQWSAKPAPVKELLTARMFSGRSPFWMKRSWPGLRWPGDGLSSPARKAVSIHCSSAPPARCARL